MKLEVLLTPATIGSPPVADRAVVVFDVLRATTTMTAALAAGVAEIRIFDSLEGARAAAAQVVDPVLCGERNCLRPEGFTLGNSPGGFVRQLHAGKTVFMSTTNGTRAIVAARGAKLLLVGAIVNAAAVARRLAGAGLDVILLCAGTDGQPAMEDLIGAGAVIDSLAGLGAAELESDLTRLAVRLFRACRTDLRGAMADATGGRNVIAAGLAADVEFAARLDSVEVVGEVREGPLRVARG
jgi:2-phosphosulfolactate phosphatase